MASGAAPCSDQRSSAKAAAKGSQLPPQGNRSRKWATDGGGAAHCEICVVCGDRACNHHYYGVAACHGCKCFFWRSIKNKMKYICRGDGQCDIINPNHRNSCRFCRLQRCLKAGMQPESVRMPKEGDNATRQIAILEQCLKGTKEAEGLKRKWEKNWALSSADAHCPLCHQQRLPTDAQKNGQIIHSQQIVTHSFPPNAENGKIGGELCQQLVRKLVEIETNINEVADFSENEAPKGQLGLDSLFSFPELLDRFRTQVNYCIRLRRVSEDELEFCKYRTLAKAVDYIRALSLLETKFVRGTTTEQTDGAEKANKEWLSERDKIILLRHCFAPLALFDIAAGTSFTTKDTQNLLCLPTGLTVCANEEIVPNGFLSQQIVARCVTSLVRVLTELSLDQEEFVMVKLIIVLAMDSNGIADLEGQQLSPAVPRGNLLSSSGQNFVERLRDNVHSALYNHSPKRIPSSLSALSSSDAALRFAKLLHILPKLMLLSRDLVEHIRMVHTFPTASSRPTDPLFFEMFGDIFYENGQQGRSVGSSSSDVCIPVGNSTATSVLSPQPQRVRTLAVGHGEGATVPEIPADKLISAQQLKAEFGCPPPPADTSPHQPHCLLPPSAYSLQKDGRTNAVGQNWPR